MTIATVLHSRAAPSLLNLLHFHFFKFLNIPVMNAVVEELLYVLNVTATELLAFRKALNVSERTWGVA